MEGLVIKKDPSLDRRQYPRLPSEALLSIARVDERDRLAQAVDLSSGGIRFQCVGLELELGALVRVGFKLDDQEVSVVGKLVRVTDLDDLTQEYALAFAEADPGTLDLLHKKAGDPR